MSTSDRTRELASLDQALDRVCEGSGGVVLLVGEAGIGKSWLLDATCDRARRRGLPVARGAAWEAGGAPSYWPWTQVVRGVLEVAGATEALSASRRRFLGALLPELAGGDVDVAGPARFELIDALSGWLFEVGRQQPLVIALEDLHAADPDTVMILEALCRSLGNARVLVVGTSRDAGSAHGGLMRGSRVLRPSRLDRAGVQALLSQRVHEVSEAMVQEVGDISDGNPLFVVEFGRLLAAGGRLGAAIPPTIRTLIEERLDAFDPEVQRVLGIAAVLGRELPLKRLRSLAGDGLDAAIRSASDAQILLWVGPDRLRFSHVLVRDVLEHRLGSEAASVHLHVGRALAAELPPPWSKVAHHLLLAGPDGRDGAVDACVAMADEAERGLAFVDAERACDQALSLLDDGELRSIDLFVRRARARVALRRFDDGLLDARRAFDLAEDCGDAPGMTRAALAFGAGFRFGHVDGDLVAMLEGALGALPDDEIALRARAAARLAAARQPADDPRGPIALARKAIELAVGQDDRTRLHTLRDGSSAMVDMCPASIRAPISTDYLTIAGRLGSRRDMLRAHLHLVFLRWELGELEAGDHHHDAALAVALQIDDPATRWQVTALNAMRALWAGRLDAARERIEEVAAAGKVNSNARLVAAHQRAAVAQLSGDEEAMDAAARHFTDVFVFDPSGPAALWGRTLRVGFAPEPDRQIRMRLFSKDFMARLEANPDMTLLPFLAQAAVARSDTPMAERILARLQPHRRGFSHFGAAGFVLGGPFRLVIAELEATLGRTADAERSREVSARVLRVAEGFGLLRQLGRVQEAPPVEGLEFASDPEGWRVRYRGKDAVLPDVKGVSMVARLVAQPGQEIHVVDLVHPDGAGKVDVGDSGEAIDGQARAAYRERAETLADHLADARERSDQAGIHAIRTELEFLAEALSSAVGLGGRSRRVGSNVERARVSVRKRIKDGLDRISAVHPAAGDHLSLHVRTGTYCVYLPGT